MATSSSDSAASETMPLDMMKMQASGRNGILAFVPAINLGFKENRYFVPFQRPPSNSQSTPNYQAEEDEWLESADFIEEDLHWLLKVPYHRFWSQVVHDDGIHIFMDAYLTHAPRHYDLTKLCYSERICSYLEKFHSLFFRLLLRMSTHKESKENHMTPTGFGEIIYDKYVFDIPRIMDLCSVYGFENSALVSKMITNIFKHQPKYIEDLNTTSQSILESLTSIEEQLGLIFTERQSKSKTYQHMEPKKAMEFFLSFHDIVNYITDVSFTLYIFLEVYSPACQTFYQNGATLRIATFYEHIFPQVEKEIVRQKYNKEAKSLFEEIKDKVSLSKTLLVKLFRNILNYCLIADILDSSSSTSKTASSSTEHFLEIFTILGPEKHFLKDYNVLFPFETDIELFTQMNLQLDYDRLNYIFLSMHDTDETIPSQSAAVSELVKKTESNKKRQKDERSDAPKPAPQPEPGPSNGQIQPSIPDQRMDSLITSVQDVLPHLGDGFIERCLLHYHYDDERVIDAVLTNMLPDQLTCLDHTLKREAAPSYSILSDRKNVFDNDEFDFFNKADIQMDKIHIGKKDKTPSSYQSLKTAPPDDSEFLKKLTLAYEEDTTFDDPGQYSDEYDDTYDSAMIGLKEPIPEGEPEPESANDVKTEEPSSEPRRDTSRDFCTNPEIQRERYAQRRESQMARRGGPPPRDPARSRQNKDRNKSQVANHNRRKQADFKRSRGMGPL